MRVLVVSQYFPPESGATQNRLGAIAHGLAARGHEVAVICEQPCHPVGAFFPGFGRRMVAIDRRPGLTIHRLWVAASPQKTTLRRLAFYGTFAIGAGAAAVFVRRPDVVFASSPPLPAVLSVAGVCTLRRVPIVVDVRDIWPAAAEALGELSNARVMKALEQAEQWLYRRAAAVTATTRPFCEHIDRVAGHPLSVHLPNGALDELIALPDRPPAGDDGFMVGYAGNFGIAQGMEIVLDAAEELRGEPIRFVLVGDGPLGRELRDQRTARGLDNVEFRSGIPVRDVGAFLQDSDALLIPLRAHSLLAGFIPSKLYDAMAVGRPAIVAAEPGGEAAALTQETGAGVVIPPEDGRALADAVRALAANPDRAAALGQAGRRAAAGFARSRQLERLEKVLEQAADSGGRSRTASS